MKTSNISQKVESLPQTPGSYIFKDAGGKVIYVGKAKNLKSRVKSYFSVSIPSDFKTAELVSKINDLEFIKVGSEFEALILEAELIKKYRPKYNIVLKDDKSRIYIVIRDDIISILGKKYKLPKVITARKPDLRDSDIVFGPYPNNVVVRKILTTSRKIFPFRDCNYTKFAKYRKIGSPCLYGHMGICPSPCLVSEPSDLSSYKKNIFGLKKILSGNATGLIKNIKRKMQIYSQNEKFEEAAVYRDLLDKFYFVQKTFREAEEYINNPYLIDDINKKSLEEIKDFLPVLKNLPRRIECYDISNISGKEAVGSMVVSINGSIDKSEYKRFKIKFKKTPDDFGMMYEVLYRRLKRELPGSDVKSWGLPDLIVVDGGKPQVSSASDVLRDLEILVPVVGIAKKYETLVYKEGKDFIEKTFPKDSLGMKLIIKLRDESHRFAQSYHHLLRKRSLL
ncbi:excinuclease ABC subunit UvrC [Patescibacteria group bacterium]|nr:excinuclease ABC subunit UvrC [Patescibacteria group bacterium]